MYSGRSCTVTRVLLTKTKRYHVQSPELHQLSTSTRVIQNNRRPAPTGTQSRRLSAEIVGFLLTTANPLVREVVYRYRFPLFSYSDRGRPRPLVALGYVT